AQDFDFKNELPQHEVTLETFEIGRYPVTNAEYAVFVKATGHATPRHWHGGMFPEELADHPVVYVTWHDALAYAEWLRERTGEPYRLPTEAEWEKAARGEDGRRWPWGDDWRPEHCNMRIKGPGKTTPVGQYAPAGDSPYGCADMAGNVFEWCHSSYQPYPYGADDGREDPEVSGPRVLRGGSWIDENPGRVRCASRIGINPDLWDGCLGFRVVQGDVE
ncbi:MAG: formylglycine-generating enzyme family protein, partial [Anaerolineae bacterium]